MTDLIKKEETALSTETAHKGFEAGVDRTDLIIPRAKKIEAMSPEMKDPDLIKAGIMPGKIINSITKEVLPERFIPIIYFKQWIRWNANKIGDRGWVDGFGPRDIVYITQDPKDPRVAADGVWDGDLPPLAMPYINFLSIFEGQSVPVVVSFGGTNYRAGKTLLSLATFKGGNLFSNKYKLKTIEAKNDKGSWYTLSVSFSENATQEETATAERLWESFRHKEVKVHSEESEEQPF